MCGVVEAQRWTPDELDTRAAVLTELHSFPAAGRCTTDAPARLAALLLWRYALTGSIRRATPRGPPLGGV
ncbi:hypothetical protein J7E93_07300 [Streptomyces sp. ISL-36]|uniref:hypothetical protein n=1 Tax=Streptomyces sp. ISL-36 TaxID=2819182 RepID=UPI001BED0B17|nr:hypothetical protein [Streptomyces sp. ISL-36]MBT2439929.1 hypothetical protein [Streptomyces sp. ISL-36]